jgi:shikimate dehydrogenase
MSAPGKLAVIGDPVSHSLSPALQNAAFLSLGLDLEYSAVPVPAAQLATVFPMLRESYLGLNVTRPLKELILDLCDRLSPEAAEARSVNTIVFREGAAFGASTDVLAFMPALRTVTRRMIREAVILGTGGAARAAAVALVREGAVVHVSGRNAAAGVRMSSELGVTFAAPAAPASVAALGRADLLVNTTPVGGDGSGTDSPLPDAAPLPPGGIVFDLVYRPRVTSLLRRARAEGCETVEGLCLLIEQAALSFEMWTGRGAPREVMRAAALAAYEGTDDMASERSAGLQREQV